MVTIKKIIKKRIVTTEIIKKREKTIVFEFDVPKSKKLIYITVTIYFDYITDSRKKIMREIEIGCISVINTDDDDFWLNVNDTVHNELKSKFFNASQKELEKMGDKILSTIEDSVEKLNIVLQ